ncbi:MAG: terminase small subunit [Oscillospiraceae bacterium]|nr:terminase small subunit [Oscillospiraceae bacterium]
MENGGDELQNRIVELGKALTFKQRLFVHQYMVDLNGTQAAIRAGYAEKTAASTASRMLRMPEIVAYRDALMEERFRAIGIDKYNIAMCVWQIYLKCTEKVPVLEWDSVTHGWVESGTWQFDVKGALKALEMLRQMLPDMNKENDNGGDDFGGLEAMLAGSSGGREF